MVAVAEPLKPVSDAGLMPAGWTSVEIGSQIDLLTGFPFPSRGFGRSGARLVRGSNVKRGTIDWSDGITEYWPIITPDIRKYLLKQGDIVIAMDGALVGHSYAEVSEADLPSLLLQRVARVRSKNISQKFLKSWICSSYFTQHCDALKTNTAIPHISPADIRSFRIALPPTIAEQDAIAEALNDADAHIEWLERMLKKKRALMQGAMQELLTGKRRLPGFSGDWKTVPIGGLLTVRHGKGQHDVADPSGPYPILATGGQIGRATKFLYDKPSVLIGRKGTIDRPQFMDAPFWTVDTLFYTEIREPNDAKFIYYNFCLVDWKRHNEASGVPSLNAKTIESIELFVPSDSAEQNAISSVLTGIENDIDNVAALISKARDIKEGMIQELLTGRVRLV